MLNENIRNTRKNKGYTQEELAVRLHVTRQTVSKWEKGISVPDAALLSEMAEILDVSVSELLGENVVERQDYDAIVEQLSRINEQMAVRNRRASRIIRTLGIILLVIIVSVLTIVIVRISSDMSHHLTTDHIGKLTYVLPDPDFVHEKDDIGVTVEKDGRERISAKSYRKYSDMTEISIWGYGTYDKGAIEILDEFRESHETDLVGFSGNYGNLPAVIDEIVSATDQRDDYVGRYYEAYVVIGGDMYCVEVQNGDDPIYYGESLISSMDIDESIKDEYR